MWTERWAGSNASPSNIVLSAETAFDTSLSPHPSPLTLLQLVQADGNWEETEWGYYWFTWGGDWHDSYQSFYHYAGAVELSTEADSKYSRCYHTIWGVDRYGYGSCYPERYGVNELQSLAVEVYGEKDSAYSWLSGCSLGLYTVTGINHSEADFKTINQNATLICDTYIDLDSYVDDNHVTFNVNSAGLSIFNSQSYTETIYLVLGIREVIEYPAYGDPWTSSGKWIRFEPYVTFGEVQMYHRDVYFDPPHLTSWTVGRGVTTAPAINTHLRFVYDRPIKLVSGASLNDIELWEGVQGEGFYKETQVPITPIFTGDCSIEIGHPSLTADKDHLLWIPDGTFCRDFGDSNESYEADGVSAAFTPGDWTDTDIT